MKIKLGELEKRSQGSSAEQREQRLSNGADQPSGAIRGNHFETSSADFRRTDEDVRQDILNSLESCAPLVSEVIDISVDDGIVMLEGAVSNEGLKTEAGRLAGKVLDVREVKNRLEVI